MAVSLNNGWIRGRETVELMTEVIHHYAFHVGSQALKQLHLMMF